MDEIVFKSPHHVMKRPLSWCAIYLCSKRLRRALYLPQLPESALMVMRSVWSGNPASHPGHNRVVPNSSVSLLLTYRFLRTTSSRAGLTGRSLNEILTSPGSLSPARMSGDVGRNEDKKLRRVCDGRLCHFCFHLDALAISTSSIRSLVCSFPIFAHSRPSEQKRCVTRRHTRLGWVGSISNPNRSCKPGRIARTCLFDSRTPTSIKLLAWMYFHISQVQPQVGSVSHRTLSSKTSDHIDHCTV